MDCFASLAMTPIEVLLPHHRRGLPEQDPALFLGAVDRLAEIRIDLFRQGIALQLLLAFGPFGDAESGPKRLPKTRKLVPKILIR